MDCKIIKNDFIKESTYVFRHKSGLTIYISPKEGYSKKCAFFATHFGSINNCFKMENMADFTTIPDGVAHFLEHKLFESETGDAFTKYAKTGASANAYTSFTHTAYYFSCTDKLEENLEILTELIKTPYFTKENVDKEQGIIGQEINMYLDNPSWRVYFNLLEAMFVNCSVKKDIAGSVESISEITPELLYDCYKAFYNASNMVLCICGDVNAYELAEKLEKMLDGLTEEIKVVSYSEEEPKEVSKSYVEQKLSVSMPIFNIGFKDHNTKLSGDAFVKRGIVGKIALDLLFGRSSKFYNSLYNEGLINESFDLEYCLESEFAYSLLAGESENPKKVYEKALETLEEYYKCGISQKELERQINIAKSTYICQFNRVEETARAIMDAHFNNYNLYNTLDVYDTVTLEDINSAIKELKKEFSVLSVINPI